MTWVEGEGTGFFSGQGGVILYGLERRGYSVWPGEERSNFVLAIMEG